MIFALTINPGHASYRPGLTDTVGVLVFDLRPDFLEIVAHQGEPGLPPDHYHGLISVPDDFDMPPKSFVHYEPVRNLKAYRSYMHSHDVIEELQFGELPYTEIDSMVDYLEIYGPVKTARKYGWQAIRYYKQMKEFYEDTKKESQ